MRILFLEWNGYGNEDIVFYFKQAGHEVSVYPFAVNDNPRFNPAVSDPLCEYLKSGSYDFVFSFNYYPTAAIAAYHSNTKYVSWTYDSPYLLLFSHTIALPTNYIFVFDKDDCRELWALGLTNVRYLPLAANISRFQSMYQNPARQKKYASDIAFVGSLYTEKKHALTSHFKNLPEYAAGYLDGIVRIQKNVYGSFLLEKLLTSDILEELQKAAPLSIQEGTYKTAAWIYANYFLARSTTALERTELLTRIDSRFPNRLKLYTHEATPFLTHTENCGRIDYYTQMPYVFQNSKINLNITLKSIHTGIPLRAIDIMGCGGFLLTNYQEDFLDTFEPDADFVYYESTEDCLDKIEYYLSHERERAEIAENALRKISEYHTYPSRIKEIIEVVSASNI